MVKLITQSVQDTLSGFSTLFGNDMTIVRLKDRSSRRRTSLTHPAFKGYFRKSKNF